MTIAEQMSALRDTLDPWANQNGGKAFVASDMVHLWEIAWAKPDSPRVIICYMGEDIRGDFSLAASLHRVDRQFSVMMTRGRGFNPDRGDSLTDQRGTARPLFDLVEEAREIIRAIIGISEELPVDYKGVRTVQLGDQIIDAYMIEFSCATDLPGLSVTPDNPSPPASS
jgi:hypothetical protein